MKCDVENVPPYMFVIDLLQLGQVYEVDGSQNAHFPL